MQLFPARLGAPPGSARFGKPLTAPGIAVVLGILALGAGVLPGARRDAWRQAEEGAGNLTLVLAQEIARDISTNDHSIRGAADAMHTPGIDLASPRIRRMAMFGTAATAEYLGSILILNKPDDVVFDSTSLARHRVNFADRDYFHDLEAMPDAPLHISRAFRGKLRGGDPSIAIARRVAGPDGAFEGMVQGALRLAYFQDMFGRLGLGAHGSMALVRTDSHLLACQPLAAADLDRDMSAFTHLTVSIGVSSARPLRGEGDRERDAMLKAADAALCESKRAGRDHVSLTVCDLVESAVAFDSPPA